MSYRPLLLPISFAYRSVVEVRNALYDRGWLETRSLGARTIGVGNITAGGTGKTPLVRYIAEVLFDRGLRPCILTRGYGRKDEASRVLVSDGAQLLADSAEGGDEPIELASELLGKATVIADADRVGAAKWAKDHFNVSAFILDDAFQHRKARRDLDIVCIDATDPFGGEQLLPAGTLREPIASLRRADVVVITRSELAGELTGLLTRLSRLAPDARLFTARSRVVVDKNQRAFAFCGIAKPDNFFRSLLGNGVDLAGTHSFADHHRYSSKDIGLISQLAERANAKCLITTGKDAVKISGSAFSLPLKTAELRFELDDRKEFERLLLG